MGDVKHSNPLTTDLPENDSTVENLDVRDRIRINKEKLDRLLNQNPLADNQGGSKEEHDLPFHSGPLSLSIFRTPSPPPPAQVNLNLSDRYDVTFQSFLKHRPLSENFAQTFQSYDLSSSSDDEVSEPQPESPLNLSDTESIMSTGHRSPGIFGRRDNKLFSSSQSNTTDNRPRSLYDSAKPRPPKEHHGSKDKVSDKINKLMHFRKRSKSTKNENHFQSSYEKSYEPVPPNVTWTNVVAQSNVSKLQPHPPTTSPTHAMPNPKKKRHAPKPPTNIPPYNQSQTSPLSSENPIDSPLQINGGERITANTSYLTGNETSVDSVSSCLIGAELSRNINGSPNANELTTDKAAPRSPQINSELHASAPVRSLTQTSELSSDSTDSSPNRIEDITLTTPTSSHPTKSTTSCELKESSNPSQTEMEETQIPTTSDSLIENPVLRHKTSEDPTLTIETSTSSSKPDAKNSDGQTKLDGGTDGNNSTTNGALVSLEKQKLVIEELLKVSKATNSHSSRNIEQAQPLSRNIEQQKPLSQNIEQGEFKFPATSLKSRDLNPSNYYRYSESAISQPLASSLQGTELIVSLIVDDLVSAVESKLSVEAKRLNQSQPSTDIVICKSVTDGVTGDVTDTVLADVTDSVENCQRKELRSDGKVGAPKRPKSHKHRISMDNASSGYSSPGSGDETPLSPETPISPLTVPSPTSSYYSASLSASSSRVSNLSRELTLSKSPVINENTADDDTKTKSLEHQLMVTSTSTVTTARGTSVSSTEATTSAAQIAENGNKIVEDESDNLGDIQTGVIKENSDLETDNFSDISVKFRNKPTLKVRSKSEYIPYRSDHPECIERSSTVSICMVEKPIETGSLSRAQARLYHQKGSRKAQAAGQKSRAFAMRAKLRWPRQRHSYAESSTGDYILDESDHDQSAPSSNLVSHFVSTRDISTYYDGTEYRTMTADEILHSKREEIFNAYKHPPVQLIGGSVRHLPVSTKEFGFMNDIIQEELDSDQTGKTDFDKNKENPPNIIQPAKAKDVEKHNSIHRQPSEASSSSSGGTRYSSVLHDSTWSVGGDLSNQNRQRKPSLRKRIQSAFSFQNIRKAMSMEKLNEEERSMSHHYLNGDGSQYLGSRERSATLQEKSTHERSAPEPIRKAPSISSLISSVRIRKRHPRMKNDKRNRHTIADPESFAKASETESKRYHKRPASAVLSSANRRRLEDVGNPSYFRPIGRVLQMNPAEGTLLVEMVKPSSGPSGFYIARKKESGDFGSVFISRLSDSYPDKMFAGLMRTGDEITEVNNTSVSGLTLDQVYDLILDSDKTLLKLKPAQVHIV